MSSKRYAQVDKEYCVSCGTCTKACPLQAISVPDGMCARECPASVIKVVTADV